VEVAAVQVEAASHTHPSPRPHLSHTHPSLLLTVAAALTAVILGIVMVTLLGAVTVTAVMAKSIMVLPEFSVLLALLVHFLPRRSVVMLMEEKMVQLIKIS